MITTLATALSLLFPTLCGYIIISVLLYRDTSTTILERITVGFALGLGLLTFFMFYMGLLDIKFTSATLYIVQALYTLPFIAGYIFLQRTRPHTVFKNEPTLLFMNKTSPILTMACAVILVWLAMKAGFVLFESFNRPIYSHDNWSSWSSGAKFFYYRGGLELNPSSEYFFGGNYRIWHGHPLLTPLAEVWMAVNLGRFDEILSKAWSPFYYIATITLLYSAIKREGGRVTALACAFMLSSAPLLTYHALDSYADMPLSFYVLGGSVFLWRYMEERRRGPLMVAGLLFAIAAFTKNEGVLYLLFAFTALFIYILFEKKLRWRELLYFLVPAMIILPWIAFKFVHGIGYGHHIGTAGLHWIDKLHFEIFPIYFKELFYHANHGLIIAFAVVITVIGFMTILKSNIKYLYVIIILIICSFLFLYTTTMDFESVTKRTASNRNILTFIPLLLYTVTLVTVRLVATFNGAKNKIDK